MLNQSVTRRIEFIQDASSKFWEVRCDGKDVVIRYGRIGSSGQMLRKSFDDTDAASQHAEKLVGEKTGKGYVEVSV